MGRIIMFFIFRCVRFSNRKIGRIICTYITLLKFWLFKISIGKDFISNGIPIVDICKGGKMSVGISFRLNNGMKHNIIGRQQKCIFIVGEDSNLVIGNNVAISGTAIICHNEIVIRDNVRIGGNTVIYDTDFHDINYKKRIMIPENTSNVLSKRVEIMDNVFVGAHVTILKGVTIGSNSVIGAGSVISKNIPENQMWAGNPAIFLKEIDFN
jgi:acetyltransferase-like isoleucine patch superfamily enzyme